MDPDVVRFDGPTLMSFAPAYSASRAMTYETFVELLRKKNIDINACLPVIRSKFTEIHYFAPMHEYHEAMRHVEDACNAAVAAGRFRTRMLQHPQYRPPSIQPTYERRDGGYEED